MYSTFVAYLLFIFSGWGVLGLHRHYLGKHATGILWLLTGGLGTIGLWYDFFTLPSQVREANIRKVILDDALRPKNISGRSWHHVNDGETRFVSNKEPVERTILKIAKSNKGILSASDLALSGDIPIEEAKRSLEAMVSKGYAELRVRQSGAIVYTIPDLMDSNEPLLDM